MSSFGHADLCARILSLSNDGVMPGRSDFVAVDEQTLYDYLRNNGGLRAWAADCGLTMKLGTPGNPYWTPERIEEDLRVIVEEHGRWLVTSELEALGNKALADAAARLGGLGLFAERIGVEVPPASRAGSSHYWDAARVDERLNGFLDELGTDVVPTRGGFIEAGEAALYSQLRIYGGIDYWRTKMLADRAA